jgi:AICAR transformylase/IMP cyclohydrolase PurH
VGASKVQDLRYGENPHQRGAFYRTSAAGFGAATKHQGKELSFTISSTSTPPSVSRATSRETARRR